MSWVARQVLAAPSWQALDSPVIAADCLDALRTLPDASVDAVVTDPPYGLSREPDMREVLDHWLAGDDVVHRGGGFMGQSWDSMVPGPSVWREAHRVLKPGGYLLAFGGSRTYDLLVLAIRLAGFEVRDTIAWMYGCHDDQTEVLTRRGWVNGLDLTPEDDVAQWSTDGTVELVRPIALQRYPYAGRMVRFRNADVDQLVTPNHRVYRQVLERRQVAGRRTAAWSSWQVDEAATINRWQPMRLPAGGVHDGPGIGGTDYAALLGWVWTDGGFDLHGTGVRIYQSSTNRELVDEISALLDRLGPHKRYDYQRTWRGRAYTASTWFITGELARRVRADLPGKTPTWDLLWRMTAAEKRALWDAAMKGDGSKGTRTFWQKDRAALEWAQALLATIGARGKVSSDPRGALHWQPSATVELQRRHLSDDSAEYAGDVWCVTVPSGAFIVRRAGLVSVSGNSGFPKSLDVSKAIGRAAGAERPIVAKVRKVESFGISNSVYRSGPDHGGMLSITAPATPEAAAWEGWGTALKPAFEPVVVARKPLVGTVAANVLRYGTGGLNIDACRIPTTDSLGGGATLDQQEPKPGGWDRPWRHDAEAQAAHAARVRANVAKAEALGRWPANVVLDEGAADLLDEQTGELQSGANPTRRSTDKFRSVYGDFAGQAECIPARGADAGGASRFFYCAKASRRERSAGLEHLPRGPLRWSSGDANAGSFQSAGTDRTAHNHHPTVKPIALMRWLLRLVTPPGGLVLDPFAGSGTTVCAGAVEGITVVGIERERDYAEIARQRVAWWAEHGDAAIERARDRRRAAPAREELRMEMIDDSWATVRVVHEPGCGGVCGDGCEREVLA